jgi:hypothetical protein
MQRESAVATLANAATHDRVHRHTRAAREATRTHRAWIFDDAHKRRPEDARTRRVSPESACDFALKRSEQRGRDAHECAAR